MSYKGIVLDASTLILLAKIELLALLLDRLRVAITAQVKEEAARATGRLDAQLIAGLIGQRRIEVYRADQRKMGDLVRDFRLDEGEASSVVLAKVCGAVLGIDDGPAIKACKVLGIPFVTAVHLLIRAYEQRRIDQSTALVKLEKLQRFGRYDPRILEDVMKCIQGGESP